MNFIYTILVIALITACNSTSDGIASTDSAFKTVVPETPFTNAENYVGMLPCADCEGIDVSLQLNKNFSYILNSVYKSNHVDSSNNSFKDTGTWSLQGTDTLYLTGINNAVTKYVKTGSDLIQLDGNGNRITGALADMFILHKK